MSGTGSDVAMNSFVENQDSEFRERSDSIGGNGTRPTASRAAAPWRGAKRLAPVSRREASGG
uniref:hypothetical protein n=1 Tax=Rhodococcus erythropolis TaxID=1833 RepID=UPI001C0F39FF